MTTENIENVEYDVNEPLCEIVKEGDDYFMVDLASGEKSDVLKTTDEGKTLVLPKNRANRKWLSIAKVEAALAEGTSFQFSYKATKTIGAVGTRLPNEKLISYLSPEEQEEYKAIIGRAIEARNADKAKPKTELEKAQEKLARAQAALAKLMEEAGE